MDNLLLIFLWVVAAGPFVASCIFLYGGICIKSFQEKQWAVLLMCIPIIGLPYFLVPWDGGSFIEYIPIISVLGHWFYWYQEDFIKLFGEDNPKFFKR